MKNKLVLPFALALLASLLISSVVFAQAPQRPHNSGRRGVGQVAAIGSNQFTATTRNGRSYQVLVDEFTRFRNSDETEASFSDLAVDQWVIVIAAPVEGESSGGQPQFTARLVVQLPEEIDPSQRFGIRARGIITATDLAASTFDLRDLNGQILTLAVDVNTHFIGHANGLSDLQPGMTVAAAAKEANPGYPQAVLVAARFPLANHTGNIVGVDLENGSFNLETVRNGTLTFVVTDQTHFRSPEQSVQSLGDLQPGLVATVSARQDGTQLIALLVAAANRSDLPEYDHRAAGRVVTIDDNSFTLEKPSGEQIIFSVTSETRFRSLGGRVQSLDDLRVGMGVMVGANEAGENQAILVLVRPR